MSNNDITNSIVGAILVSAAINIFIFSHRHQLNISDLFWAITSFRQKWLPQYLPLISGIFLMSGIFYYIFGYNTLNGITPYGTMNQILTRCSMFGFAISGFCIGIGSKFAQGDLIYHGFIGVAKFKLQSLLIIIVMFVAAIFCSWILSSQSMSFLTNSQINPLPEFAHLQSATINIILSVILIIVSICWLRNITDKSLIVKKILSSFISGLLLSLGFLICGLSRRKLFIQSLSPSYSWNPAFLIFLGTIIIINIIVFQIVYKLVILSPEQVESNFLFAQFNEGSMIKIRKLAGGFVFGIGLAMGGLQLTTYFIHSAIFSIPVVIIFGLFMILGTMIGDTCQINRLQIYQSKNK